VYTSTFVGGAPVNNPRVVCLISVYNPRAGTHYGGTVAGPAFKEVVEKILEYLNVPPDRTEPVVRQTGQKARN